MEDDLNFWVNEKKTSIYVVSGRKCFSNYKVPILSVREILNGRLSELAC